MQKRMMGIPELSPFAPEVMRWWLLQLFRSEAFQNTAEFEDVRNVLQDYLGSGESADYQLAGQLADIFDQYLEYRPQWIDAWQQGRRHGLGVDEIWQSKLWRYLDDGGQSAPHRVALWVMLLAALDKDKLPERYFVFGISTMAPMYLQLCTSCPNIAMCSCSHSIRAGCIGATSSKRRKSSKAAAIPI